MKWFQVDSDTPNDPKVRALVRELGAAGMGGLFFIWCHIADHGTRKPGWSIDTLGRPMPIVEIQEASKLSDAEFSKLALICTSTGHWLKKPWDQRQVIAIPAMARRADTYTKRRVRTRVEDDSKDVQRDFANKTVHTKEDKNPPTPLRGGRQRKRKGVGGSVCTHEPRCATTSACIDRTLAEGRIAS